eukprot:UN05345
MKSDLQENSVFLQNQFALTMSQSNQTTCTFSKIRRKPRYAVPTKPLPSLPQSTSSIVNVNSLHTQIQNEKNFHKMTKSYILFSKFNNERDATKDVETWTHTETQSISTHFNPKSTNVSSNAKNHSKSDSLDSNMSYMSNNSGHLMDIHMSNNSSLEINDNSMPNLYINIDEEITLDQIIVSQSSRSLTECDVVVQSPFPTFKINR